MTENLLEKNLYIYRRSYKDYNTLESVLVVIECMAGASALGALAIPMLSLVAPIGISLIEGIKTTQKVNERKQNYKLAFIFYKDLLQSYKAGLIDDKEVFLKENEFISRLEFFPREKYIKQMKLNGYKELELFKNYK